MNRTTVNISDLSPKAQELYRKIMSGKYLDGGTNVPLLMRRYFCQATLHAVREWFEERTYSLKISGMNNIPAVVALLKEMEKDPDKLMFKGLYAEYPVPEPFNNKWKKKKAKIREKLEKEREEK